ncbi:MAG: nucleotidyl transferase AbiEii/AbiGii toxin family protein [Gammaproteobacteria bacterium]|nr:nucleotidyl transferase AbiEii/AbiGii toxin family protein [Gammaproteobacteria bacterium]
MTFEELRAFVSALERAQVSYVIIGGAALNAHGLIRATEDIDIMVEPTARNVDRLRSALRAMWDDPAIDEITAGDLGGDYPAIRYGPPAGSLYIDIISRFGEGPSFADVAQQTIDLGGVSAQVATPRALFEMKRNTVREIDRRDAQALRQRFRLDSEEN